MSSDCLWHTAIQRAVLPSNWQLKDKDHLPYDVIMTYDDMSLTCHQLEDQHDFSYTCKKTSKCVLKSLFHHPPALLVFIYKNPKADLHVMNITSQFITDYHVNIDHNCTFIKQGWIEMQYYVRMLIYIGEPGRPLCLYKNCINVEKNNI